MSAACCCPVLEERTPCGVQTESDRGEGGRLVARNDGSGNGYPWALFIALLLAGWVLSLLLPRLTVGLPAGPRWLGEDAGAGIPVLIAMLLFAAFIMRRWLTRDQRKLERLYYERLRAEGKHPEDLRIQQQNELKEQTADLKKQIAVHQEQIAVLRKQAAGLRKQKLRDAIKREEELREARLHPAGSA